MKILYFVCFVFVVTVTAAAQSKTVTNSDLEKYREERVKAISDYRENYAKLGFPSPEALERRNEESRKVLAGVSAKIRTERQERERREAGTRFVQYYPRDQRTEIVWINGYPNYYYYYPNHYYYPDGRSQRVYQQPGYFAGGNFWPTGPKTPPRPIFIQPR